jgi:hypothetical protein
VAADCSTFFAFASPELKLPELYKRLPLPALNRLRHNRFHVNTAQTRLVVSSIENSFKQTCWLTYGVYLDTDLSTSAIKFDYCK